MELRAVSRLSAALEISGEEMARTNNVVRGIIFGLIASVALWALFWFIVFVIVNVR